MKANVAVEIRPGVVQFLIPLALQPRLGDAAQVKPSADDAREAAARLSQRGTQTPERIQSLGIDSRQCAIWLDAGAIDPADAVVGTRERVRAEPLHPHRLPADGPRLHSQRRAAARRLEHKVRYGQLRGGKLRQDPLALSLVPRVLQEDRKS